MVQILDPTDERVPIKRSLTPRPESLHGTVALLDISKPRGNIFLDRLEELLHDRAPGIETRRYMKPTVAKPVPEDTRQEILREADFVIEALAD